MCHKCSKICVDNKRVNTSSTVRNITRVATANLRLVCKLRCRAKQRRRFRIREVVLIWPNF